MLGSLALPALLEVLDYIGTRQLQFLGMCAVNREWRDAVGDDELWRQLGRKHRIVLPEAGARATRGSSSAKWQFLALFGRRARSRRDAHERLLLETKQQLVDNLSSRNQDKPGLLRRLIRKHVEDLDDFDVNYQSPIIEGNCLLTLVSRGSNRLKCIKLLVETFGANVEAREAGGFTALLLNAFSDNLSCVQYLLKVGANVDAVGAERNGLRLTAEHWSAIKKGYRLGDTSCWFLNNRRRERAAGQRRQRREQESAPIPFFSKLLPESGLVCTFASAQEHAVWLGERKAQWAAMRAAPRDAAPAVVPAADTSSSSAAPTYCVCGLGDVCAMICCDSAACPVSWFHLECVGLPEGADYGAVVWLCPVCRAAHGAAARFPMPPLSPSSIFAHRSARDATKCK